MDKNFYNESSARNLGWDPTWFGEKHFDDSLVRAIKKWQKSVGITADGLCGPGTFRRKFTERESDIDEYKPKDAAGKTAYIVYNGKFFPIDAEVVLQSPARIFGLLAFFAAVSLAQILLVLKKKQVEKVQAAEGI